LIEEKDKLPNLHYSEPAEGASEYYANHIQMFWSGVDLTIVFGKILHSSESLNDGILNVENRAKVTVPWPVAKLIMTALSSATGGYEKANDTTLKLPGEYNLP
jgi:hypothetical protein